MSLCGDPDCCGDRHDHEEQRRREDLISGYGMPIVLTRNTTLISPAMIYVPHGTPVCITNGAACIGKYMVNMNNHVCMLVSWRNLDDEYTDG